MRKSKRDLGPCAPAIVIQRESYLAGAHSEEAASAAIVYRRNHTFASVFRLGIAAANGISKSSDKRGGGWFVPGSVPETIAAAFGQHSPSEEELEEIHFSPELDCNSITYADLDGQRVLERILEGAKKADVIILWQPQLLFPGKKLRDIAEWVRDACYGTGGIYWAA